MLKKMLGGGKRPETLRKLPVKEARPQMIEAELEKVRTYI